jgi:hypothetical protein
LFGILLAIRFRRFICPIKRIAEPRWWSLSVVLFCFLLFYLFMHKIQINLPDYIVSAVHYYYIDYGAYIYGGTGLTNDRDIEQHSS